MKKLLYQLLLSSLLIIGFCPLSYAGWPFSLAHQMNKDSISSMLKPILPAVVNVSVQGDIPLNQLPPPVPGRPYPRHFESMGSGVIVDAKAGYILTNAHVIHEAKTITVTLSDGRVFKATLKGSDPASDIALLTITPDHLTAIPLGNSDNLKVGDFVAAIGNPFGLNQTVTSGIVSALQRTGLGIEGYENFIQTDAPINPGNSGGALINLQGQLMGINTAILAPGSNAGNIGIGFAIPINMANGVMKQLAEHGSVKRGLMGVLVQDLTPALATALHIAPDTNGALVSQVPNYSPAETAGIQTGDIIQSINGTSIHNGGQVKNIVGMLRVGDKITIKLLRKGKTINTVINLTDPKDYKKVAEHDNPFLYGLVLRDFNQTITGQGHLVGVEVVDTDEDSMAWHAGIRPGDVITSANQIAITNVAQLQDIAKQSKQELLVNVLSRGGIRFVVIK
ncbi:Do family serine endopeptidase [Rickettsiella endosymbiont of Aleochara curtula]|jgi:serine protease Do|uniref:Do family serine endopeptidase n=1 Tax=Rickettsiella endosymbiont of Aleochara curtula TaxID=3077936 RepID=UPI00313D1CD2